MALSGRSDSQLQNHVESSAKVKYHTIYFVNYMGIKLRGILGIVIALIGVFLFLTGQQGVAEYQTTAGQLIRGLSEAQQQQYNNYVLMKFGGAGMGVLGGILVLLDLVGGEGDPDSHSSDNGALFSGYDHDTLEKGTYTHYQFSLSNPAVLDASVEVLNGNPVNMIVTSKKNLNRFGSTGDIRYHEGTTGFKVADHHARGRLQAGDWVIIIDNTNRVGGTETQSPRKVDIEIDYEVRT